MSTPYLLKRQGIYYLHKRVPTHLVEKCGKQFIRKSLRTKDRKEALRLANNLVAVLESKWKETMSSYEEYMVRRLKEEQYELERIGKEVYGNLDVVNNPPHYNQAGIECIDAIEAALSPEELRGYYKGNIIKYTWRERYKNGDEDISKLHWYTNRLLTIKDRLLTIKTD